jgi:hypothetical protein
MALRIVLDDDLQNGRYGAPPTVAEIEAFRVHVIRLRLRGLLTQELCLLILESADRREALLQASQNGATSEALETPRGHAHETARQRPGPRHRGLRQRQR